MDMREVNRLTDEFHHQIMRRNTHFLYMMHQFDDQGVRMRLHVYVPRGTGIVGVGVIVLVVVAVYEHVITQVWSPPVTEDDIESDDDTDRPMFPAEEEEWDEDSHRQG